MYIEEFQNRGLSYLGTGGAGRATFYAIFAASGLAGLIYESIWTHYLKLFLGHAAYAQSLVLSIFMGGMALGAWLCSRRSTRWPDLLRRYAAAELAIGLCAFAFHPLFVGFLDIAYNSVIPGLASPAAVTAFKWGSATLLILPQSILLGMTFPLMTTGVIRIFPDNQGSTISMLYFSNSIGAAAGVLISGFLLIAWVGLPGTMATAGVINIALAATVWTLAPRSPSPLERPSEAVEGPATSGRLFAPLLLVSFVTGMASFIYEIGWIRMLSLVLGSSTHAFELMLSAFITGLALGGLWIHRTIDKIGNPSEYLGKVQVGMGVFALLTIPVYANTFPLMTWLIETLEKTDRGYVLFNIGSHGIALLVMLPTTFCAGMTLPLITVVLLRAGFGERTIGAVYASNTIGAIAGVVAAVHIGLPLLGLKGMVMAGACLDLTLGVALLWSRRPGAKALAAVVIAVGALLGVGLLADLAPHKMASGVYRIGKMIDPSRSEVLFHEDGKTATVSITRERDGQIAIRTNGKTDAGVYADADGAVSTDEPTMVLAGALGLAIHPQATMVANIGMGSGLTTHTLLASPRLIQMDTIEIEPNMVEAANYFRPHVERAYTDPRSVFHFEDAKTYFSAERRRYDIIVSEPSNPWVSGVASLFSKEFYALARRHLTDDGLLVQWLQLYDLEMPHVVSVILALSTSFDDFEIYAPNRTDLLIVARPSGTIPDLDPWIFSVSEMAHDLGRLGIDSVEDLRVTRVGDKKALWPWLKTFEVPPNSDFAPYLDQNAARARFKASVAGDLLTPDLDRFGVLRWMGKRPHAPRPRNLGINPASGASISRQVATSLLAYHRTGRWDWDPRLQVEIPQQLLTYGELGSRAVAGCGVGLSTGQWFDGMYNSVAKRMVPFLPPDDIEPFLSGLESPECQAKLDPVQRSFVALVAAIGRDEPGGMSIEPRKLLKMLSTTDADFLVFLLSTAITGDLARGDTAGALELWAEHRDQLEGPPPLALQVLLAHARSPGKP